MAANLKSRGIASLGKRFVNQIRTTTSSNSRDATTASFRRGIHVAAYEKNRDDLTHPSLVPEDVIHPSDKFWGPHPQTGVFGPETEHTSAPDGEPNSANGVDSVLEEKAFFRPTSIEDLEKPLQS